MQSMTLQHTSEGRFRSAAVARMAHLSVNTLRIWERRYQVVAPPATPSGHRLYSLHDVSRLTLLTQLTQHGHAIGTIARLSLADLQTLVDSLTPRAASPTAFTVTQSRRALAVIGQNLAHRLSSASVVRHLPVDTWASQTVYNDLPHALAAAVKRDSTPSDALDLVVQVSALQTEDAEQISLLLQRLQPQRCLVVYGFGPEHAALALTARGVTTRRTPLSDHELASILVPSSTISSSPGPRQFDDAALTQAAAMASSVACECQRHVAELTLQLAAFEQYSAQCTSRTPADAQLHAYLTQVAATSRQQFEQALQRVLRENQLSVANL
jgi:MerR family transcriptional regulator, light-induced transcriptional regulator